MSNCTLCICMFVKQPAISLPCEQAVLHGEGVEKANIKLCIFINIIKNPF